MKALKRVAKEVGLDLRGAYVNLDGGFDSRANRKCIFNAGMIPNIKENPRNRKPAQVVTVVEICDKYLQRTGFFSCRGGDGVHDRIE